MSVNFIKLIFLHFHYRNKKKTYYLLRLTYKYGHMDSKLVMIS